MAIVLDGTTGISSIGTLTGVTSISSASANTPVVMQDSGSNTNTCRAWVNFNGTGTVAIRASFNVSFITDNGTGDYTVNFTTAMPDANYCVNGTSTTDPTNTARFLLVTQPDNLTIPDTSSVRLQSRAASNGTAIDPNYFFVAIFR